MGLSRGLMLISVRRELPSRRRMWSARHSEWIVLTFFSCLVSRLPAILKRGSTLISRSFALKPGTSARTVSSPSDSVTSRGTGCSSSDSAQSQSSSSCTRHSPSLSKSSKALRAIEISVTLTHRCRSLRRLHGCRRLRSHLMFPPLDLFFCGPPWHPEAVPGTCMRCESKRRRSVDALDQWERSFGSFLGSILYTTYQRV